MTQHNEKTAPLAAVPAHPNRSELGVALVAAMRNVGRVAKSDTAKVKHAKGEYSYKFTSGDDMVAHVRGVLLEHGLFWGMVDWDIERASSPPMLVGVFGLEHPESGEVRRYTLPMPIDSRNDAAKALGGALTYLLGQATRAVFGIPKGEDDNDPDRRTRDSGVTWHDEPRAATRREQPVAPAEPSKLQIARQRLMKHWRTFAAVSVAAGHDEPSDPKAVFARLLGLDAWPSQPKIADYHAAADAMKAATEAVQRTVESSTPISDAFGSGPPRPEPYEAPDVGVTPDGTRFDEETGEVLS